jgi:alpha-L-fucosidase
VVSNYELLAGPTVEEAKAIAQGEFSNIRNNTIMQDVYFAPVRARYVVLRATRMVKEGEPMKYDQLIVR